MGVTGVKGNRGITLIALVITIIVLLILAGITISTLTGENGILTRVQTAKKTTEEKEIEEQIKLAITYSKMNENNNSKIDTGLLESGLKKNLGEDITIEKNGTNDDLPWIVIKGEDSFEISEDGTVTKSGISIIVSNLEVRNGETVLEKNSKSVAIGTPLTINFNTRIEGGTITSVEPSLPYTPADSASVKLIETFTITGTNKEGETVTREYTVDLKGYYNIPDLKVGDYITGYTLKDATDTEVQAEIESLNTEINRLSGYTDLTQTLSQESDVQWRVLEIDETTGQPTKLISADGIGSLGLRGAMGYNNAVYLLNKACEVLYSGEQGTARSIKVEDLEEYYSATGNEAKANYKVNETKFGAKKRFTGSYAYYPQIAKEESGMGIDTGTYIAEDGNTYNTLNNAGIELSDNGNSPYEGTETKGSAYDQASINGITVTQTYYSLSRASSLSSCYENSAYYSLFHGRGERRILLDGFSLCLC